MRTILAIALAAGLAGCTTTSGGGSTLASVCANEPIAYLAFQLYAPRADPALVRRVGQAHAIVQQICLNPPTDLGSALATALSAYLIVEGAAP